MLNVIKPWTPAEAIAESVRTGKPALLATRGPARYAHENELRGLAASESWSALQSAYTFVGQGWIVKLA